MLDGWRRTFALWTVFAVGCVESVLLAACRNDTPATCTPNLGPCPITNIGPGTFVVGFPSNQVDRGKLGTDFYYIGNLYVGQTITLFAVSSLIGVNVLADTIRKATWGLGDSTVARIVAETN